MENKIVLSKRSNPEQLKLYFTAVLNLSKSNNEFPVDFDEVWQLVYSSKNKAVEELKNKFLQDVDYQLINQKVYAANPQGYVWEHKYYLTTPCLEFFIARKVRSVFEIYRQVFHKVANTQISLPDFSNPAEAARAWAAEYEQRQQLALVNKRQAQEIEVKDARIIELDTAVNNMKPKVSYVDNILQCKETINVTQIAQDYGMSAKAFNILLRNLKIQHKVGQVWIVYGKYLAKGYVQSETFTYDKSNGTQGVRTFTKWSQRGRLFLYNSLKAHNIIPLIEQSTNNEK